MYRWCFTLPCKVTLEDGGEEKDVTVEEVRTFLKRHAKNWVFQKEQGVETGYLHYQGACALNVKVRNFKQWHAECPWLKKGHFSKMAGGKEAFDYALKDDTRVEGPWTDKDRVKWVHPSVVGAVLRPWQAELVRVTSMFSGREIYVVQGPGNDGKSWMARWYLRHTLGWCYWPLVEGLSGKELQQAAYQVISKYLTENYEEYGPKGMVFDIPRANQAVADWNGIVGALEVLVDGTAQDLRYKTRMVEFKPAPVVLMTNSELPEGLLSTDRLYHLVLDAEGGWFWAGNNQPPLAVDEEEVGSVTDGPETEEFFVPETQAGPADPPPARQFNREDERSTRSWARSLLQMAGEKVAWSSEDDDDD